MTRGRKPMTSLKSRRLWGLIGVLVAVFVVGRWLDRSQNRSRATALSTTKRSASKSMQVRLNGRA